MISLGFDYAIRITTDSPVLDDVLTECYQAVNAVLAKHLLMTNYDTQVANLGPLRAQLQREMAAISDLDTLLAVLVVEPAPVPVEDLPGPFGTTCPCGSTTHVLSDHPTRNFPHDIPDPIAEHRAGKHTDPEPECCAACVVVLSRTTGISPETYAKYLEEARRQAPTEKENPS